MSMRQFRAWRGLLPLVVLLILGTLAVRGRQPAGRLDQIRPGITDRQVKDVLGPPAHTARQIFYQGRLEQWFYDKPEPCRIDLLFRLGKEPQVQSIQRGIRIRP